MGWTIKLEITWSTLHFMCYVCLCVSQFSSLRIAFNFFQLMSEKFIFYYNHMLIPVIYYNRGYLYYNLIILYYLYYKSINLWL